MSLESYDMNGTREMDSYNTSEWDYIVKLESSYHGIIPRKWNHTMGSYHGDGILPLGSYQSHDIIPKPWNHTKDMESYHCDHTKAMESYHGHGMMPYHAQIFSYNIYISKQVYQNNNRKFTGK